MSKHDTWVRLKPGHPFESIEELFPEGFPMRDPFPMGISADKTASLWFMDDDRLSPDQSGEIAQLIANKFGVSVAEVLAESISDGFAINSSWIESMWGDAECMQRTLEAANLTDAHDQPSKEAWEAFVEQQYRDWIDGDRIPDPLPENFEDLDPRLKDPAMEEAYKKRKIDKLLNEGNYSYFDILSGKAMTEVLNQIDPDHEY